MGDFYDINYKLYNMLDINGEKPEVFIADGNRTAGKSFSIKSKILKEALEKEDENQFIYLYRFKDDMPGCADSFFGDVVDVKYDGAEYEEKSLASGKIRLMLFEGKEVGFALAVNIARKYKQMSAVFRNVGNMFFDEYQDEDNVYVPMEVQKLISIHTTVARGKGKNIRYVPLYLASNTVSILNPYYSTFGINKRLKTNTRFLRGDGWVFERTFNKNAAEAFQNSGFNRAFKNNGYFQFASENQYLNDNYALIEKPKGRGSYMLTIKNDQTLYGVYRYPSCVYVSKSYDESFLYRVCFTVNDVTDDRFMRIGTTNYLVQMMRTEFNRGNVRFQDLECKNTFLDMVSFL